MIVAIDALYHDGGARVGALAFERWEDEHARHEWVTAVTEVAEYEPGEFYMRELPCLLKALAEGREVLGDAEMTTVIVDGYVWLNASGRAGLGAHLHKALDGNLAVVGVAKNAFRDNDAAVEVFRGDSKRPLYVTSEGMDVGEASRLVASMDGPYRVPTLLRRVDELSRG